MFLAPMVATACLFLVAGYDVSRCYAFYREANLGVGALPASAEDRPRRLAPDQVTLRHALLFLLQKANYYWQMITALPLLAWLHLRPKRATALDVARLIIDTSLSPWISARQLDDGGVAATLRVERFAFPLLPDRFDVDLLVDFELRHPDAPVARVLRFELDGMTIDSPDEQLSILAMMVSSVAHPVVHSFNNRLYQSHADERLAAFEDFFLHGQYLNWCAWFWPGLFFRIPCARGHHWYKRVLAFNAELPLPAHGRASLAQLLPYSRSIRFLMGARPVLARALRRHGLQVDVEALFLCSILHAIDHVSCDAHTRGRLLRNEKLSNAGWFNLIALIFYRPSQHFCTNLLAAKRDKNALYQELYTGLHAIDPGLADEVTLSISY